MTDLIVETPDVELDVDGVAVIGGASYTAGAGIDITNNVISVDNTVALNSDVVHKTGDEDISGTKTFENQSLFIGEKNGCDSILVGNGGVTIGIGAEGISTDGDTEYHGFIAFPDTTQILPGTYKVFATTDQIPASTSQLENDSGFITNVVDDLTNYRTSSAQDTIDSNKQPLITSSNKLSSDLVDDTNHTNKFVSATDISNWNGKAEVSQIPTNVSQLNNDSGYLTSSTLPIASDSAFGVIKVTNSSNGLRVTSTGIVTTVKADNTQIAGKSNEYRMIVPANLDYAIEQGLGNNALTWTEQEKASARATIGAISLADLPIYNGGVQ